MNRNERIANLKLSIEQLTVVSQLLMLPLVVIVCLGGNMANLVDSILIQPIMSLLNGLKTRLHSWPLIERRTGPQYRLLGDRRQPAPARVWWWPFADPTPERNNQVAASAIFGMTLVLVTGLALASQGKFDSLFFIPAYGVFLLVILTTRAWRLAQVNS